MAVKWSGFGTAHHRFDPIDSVLTAGTAPTPDLRMDFRGAIIEDLNLPPVLAIDDRSTLADALDIVMEQYPEVLPINPVINIAERCLVGYLTASTLELPAAYLPREASEPVSKYIVRKNIGSATISDPLTHLFHEFKQGAKVVEVRDVSQRYLMAVCTYHDLRRRYPRLPEHPYDT